MDDTGSGKIKARELQALWKSMIEAKHLHPEIAYRFGKLADRMVPLADKIFLKTVRARQLLLECREKTVLLQDLIESNGNDTFLLLTNLEKTFEHLLTKTYEFRIKAG